METVILYSCNIWKGSLSTLGVFTNRRKLNKTVAGMLKDKSLEITISKDSPFASGIPLKDWSIQEMHDNIEYLAFQEIDLNEI